MNVEDMYVKEINYGLAILVDSLTRFCLLLRGVLEIVKDEVASEALEDRTPLHLYAIQDRLKKALSVAEDEVESLVRASSLLQEYQDWRNHDD